MNNIFLYQELDILRKTGNSKEMPAYIETRLSAFIKLREYQKKAFENTITYLKNENLRKNKQVHLLYHMATGSGKTVMMAGLILYLYQEGYRNFLFFVNQNNIVEKTKENFLNSASSKYLFADNIEIFGERIRINEVDNFSMTDKNAINICFQTIQYLHIGLGNPKENELTLEDFEDDKTVLISDESHHVNTITKKPTVDEKAIENSWEYSVDKIFRANKDNIMLEFTATADLKDKNVKEKYLDKIIFDYPLEKFRESGFTKDFQNMAFDYEIWERTLLALIISEYRKNLFADLGQNTKPVILLKSRIIKDSSHFYNVFFKELSKLKPEQILSLETNNNAYLKRALIYFKEKDSTFKALTEALKLSFAEENAIIMNGSTDNTTEQQLAVNSLEDTDNPYRIIFTVDMLNEGWDVLNLFDIVRLYETRQGGGKPSPYTIKEAQLIGRGARYCPFIDEDIEEEFIRKYDSDLENDNRILETLLYHSKYDHRYITEINQALKETGLLPDDSVDIEYKLKEEFKESDFYKNGILFANKKIPKSRTKVKGVEPHIRHLVVDYKVSAGDGAIYSMFEAMSKKIVGTEKKSETYQLKDMPKNILLAAVSNYDALKFNVLKSHYPNLMSMNEFIRSADYLGNITVNVQVAGTTITPVHMYHAVRKVFAKVSDHINNIKGEFEGTKEFFAKKVSHIIRDKTIRLSDIKEDGLGTSQSIILEDLQLDLSNKKWFVFEDNFGTTEEKAFVKYFDSHIEKLRKKYDEIYLIRNERFAELAIYEFTYGKRFEPDFILLLKSKNSDGYLQEQIYIEPKGDGFIKGDLWKEEFMLELKKNSIAVKKYADDNEYRIFALPFYNRNFKMKEFSEAIEKL